MYVAVKGGERAIDNAHAWLAEERRGDPAAGRVLLPAGCSRLGRAAGPRAFALSLYSPREDNINAQKTFP